MPTAVVISTWSGHSRRPLSALCDSLRDHPAGLDYSLFLCANGLEYEVSGAFRGLFDEVFVRENSGYNLGAWDHAWRRLGRFDRFLFLQDECLVRRDGWLRDFTARWDDDPRCGVVGENLYGAWDRPWEQLTDPTFPRTRDGDPVQRAARARFYRDMLARWGIPEGPTARVMTTVVQYTSRAVLEEVGGYNLGRTHEEAVAAEIGFSRKLEARGRSLIQVGRRRHSRIAHPQWPIDGFFHRMKQDALLRLH